MIALRAEEQTGPCARLTFAEVHDPPGMRDARSQSYGPASRGRASSERADEDPVQVCRHQAVGGRSRDTNDDHW